MESVVSHVAAGKHYEALMIALSASDKFCRKRQYTKAVSVLCGAICVMALSQHREGDTYGSMLTKLASLLTKSADFNALLPLIASLHPFCDFIAENGDCMKSFAAAVILWSKQQYEHGNPAVCAMFAKYLPAPENFRCASYGNAVVPSFCSDSRTLLYYVLHLLSTGNMAVAADAVALYSMEQDDLYDIALLSLECFKKQALKPYKLIKTKYREVIAEENLRKLMDTIEEKYMIVHADVTELD